MATIKTKTIAGQSRIITKLINGQRRVSCSCCEEDGGGCCMYPAEEGYGAGLFTDFDLPDELEIYYSKGPPENELIGPAIATYNGDATWGEFNDGNGPYVEFAGDGWLTIYAGGGPGGSAPCLITDEFPQNPVSGQDRYYIFDRFEDTYSITSPENYFAPTVERQSLCEWFGEGPPENQESDVTIFYWDGISDPAPDVEGEPQHGWHLILGSPFAVRKNDPQNSPAGTYIHPAGTVTVSE